MKKLHWIYTLAVGMIFTISVFIAMFSLGSTIHTVLRDYVFKYEDCYYASAPRIPGEDIKSEECKTDTNRTKRDLANSLSMLIVSVPVAGITYKHIKKTAK